MIGSPERRLIAYDGDDSDGIGAGPGPFGSAQIEKTLTDYLRARGVQTEGTDFTGRSDYGEFIAVDIPSGGLGTGAEVLKTEAQAVKWGGTAGIAYDPCTTGRVTTSATSTASRWTATRTVLPGPWAPTRRAPRPSTVCRRARPRSIGQSRARRGAELRCHSRGGLEGRSRLITLALS